ncbi:hypothetical protein KOI35_11175 [Actinoplanes bogorensis]|uniref:Bulb-type lectin domain-containing protein n=1 Tax=Paractinoplanes bogorensis TaxID=1610840 RepID=A0ABS5YKU7_9ACTN|nr:hypothetical protein [Actinoplanes bogorensis]MBU2664052.1 hypothetical protein [Actinoplanes bogorensis]
MARHDRPAWFGWVVLYLREPRHRWHDRVVPRLREQRHRWHNRVVLYLREPRHRWHDSSGSVRRTALVVGAAVLVGLVTAVYIGVRLGDDGRPLDDFTLPAPAVGENPAIPVSVAPEPSPTPTPSPTYASPTYASPPATTRPPATSKSPARSKAPVVFGQKTIEATSELTTGQSWSTNRLRLTVTSGGNLVLQDQGRTVWQTGTTTGVKLVMQNDGHLVLYDSKNAAVFRSETDGNPGAVLILRADGNMVIAKDGRVLFQTGTAD